MNSGVRRCLSRSVVLTARRASTLPNRRSGKQFLVPDVNSRSKFPIRPQRLRVARPTLLRRGLATQRATGHKPRRCSCPHQCPPCPMVPTLTIRWAFFILIPMPCVACRPLATTGRWLCSFGSAPPSDRLPPSMPSLPDLGAPGRSSFPSAFPKGTPSQLPRFLRFWIQALSDSVDRATRLVVGRLPVGPWTDDPGRNIRT